VTAAERTLCSGDVERRLGFLDLHEDALDELLGVAFQMDLEPAGERHRERARIGRNRALDVGCSADGVEYVAREIHVQHLVTHDVANDGAGVLRSERGARQRVERGEVRRDREELESDRVVQRRAKARQISDWSSRNPDHCMHP
jgi:hypothetical protein